MSYSHWSPLSGKADTPENYHVVHISPSMTPGRHEGHTRAVEPQRWRHRGRQEPVGRLREELGRHVRGPEEGRRSLTAVVELLANIVGVMTDRAEPVDIRTDRRRSISIDQLVDSKELSAGFAIERA